MKTYLFYYRTLLADGDVLRIQASDIREAVKSLCSFFFNLGVVPDIYLSENYQVYSNGKLSRRKLGDKHYGYLSACIKKIVDISFYERISNDVI